MSIETTPVTVCVTQEDITGVDTRIDTLEKRLAAMLRPGHQVIATKRYIVFKKGEVAVYRHWLCLQDYQFLCGINYPLPYKFRIDLPAAALRDSAIAAQEKDV